MQEEKEAVGFVYKYSHWRYQNAVNEMSLNFSL